MPFSSVCYKFASLKIIEIMDNFLELLKKRRSCRRFTSQTVDENSVCELMKAALMSPSGKRINPWEFILVEDKEMLRQLSICKAQGSALLEGAALAVVVIGDTNKTDVWVEDCSIATILIQLAAEELGLGSCWVQVRKRFDADGVSADENVKRLLAIPENYAVLSVVAIGHKERESKPFDEDNLQWEKVHVGQFGGK